MVPNDDLRPWGASFLDHEKTSLPWTSTLSYSRTFEEERDRALRHVRNWLPISTTSDLSVSLIEASIALKGLDGSILFSNLAYKYYYNFVFDPNIPTLQSTSMALGRSVDAIKFWIAAKALHQTDERIRGGSEFVDLEHLGWDQTGRAFTFRSYKCVLNHPKYQVFLFSRPIAILGKSQEEQSKRLLDLHKHFLSLDGIDQTICRLDAQGELTKEIASVVGLTSRSIENRRKKMQDIFGVEKPFEVIRITIRLEEHGLLPPLD
jgi:hypothetical protein